MLVIKTDMTYTVTHQTTHILPPAGAQNALDESHKKPSAQQAGGGRARGIDDGVPAVGPDEGAAGSD